MTYRTELLTDERDFAALGADWAGLYRRCATDCRAGGRRRRRPRRRGRPPATVEERRWRLDLTGPAAAAHR
ncbi:hypothetical protein SFUMM280S_03489 [Streptomyces fumanus]